MHVEYSSMKMTKIQGEPDLLASANFLHIQFMKCKKNSMLPCSAQEKTKEKSLQCSIKRELWEKDITVTFYEKAHEWNEEKVIYRYIL